MSNPTSNFNWQMPTASDLVTDLPADFETFGQAVDTTLAELKGGTTGQVLSKSSNTDMDFTWVAQDDSNAIQNAIVDAKGDLIAATANDTPARLAVGNNGETLVADSSTSTGLRYIPATVQANPFLNSAFQIAQRGTSFSASNSSGTSYWLDRWSMYFGTTTGYTLSQQSVSDSTNLPNIQYCARIARSNGTTGTTGGTIGQSIEIINSIPFAGKAITLSFYARKGANYSGTTITATLKSGTGTSDSNGIYNTYTGQATVATTQPTLTTTWVRYSVTGTVSSTATQLALAIDSAHTGTSGAADYYEVTGVQLDVGSVALPFRTYAGTIQGELAACQRYYTRVLASSGNNYYYYALGTAKSSTVAKIAYTMPVSMRVSPTAVEYSGLSLYDTVNAAIAVTAVTTDTPTLNNYSMDITVASGLTQFRPYYLFANNQSGGYFGLTAELQEMTMDKVTFITDDKGTEHAIIDHGNEQFTSMLKSEYDRLQAEQSTPKVAAE